MTQEITAYVAEPTEIASASACNAVQGDVNTFDLTTNEGKLATLKTLNSADSLNGHEGEILDIVDCVTKPGIRKSRDPRLPNTPCTDTYLVLLDGTVLMSQSRALLTPSARLRPCSLTSERTLCPTAVSIPLSWQRTCRMATPLRTWFRSSKIRNNRASRFKPCPVPGWGFYSTGGMKDGKGEEG